MKITMNKSLGFSMVLFMTIIIVQSCKKEDNEPTAVEYTNGFYIVNEGPFANGTGTIDFVKNTGGIYRNIFAATNKGLPLGSVLQSVEIIGSNTYAVVNNANKIEVVDTKTFIRKGTIENLPSPRYILSADGETAFVSCIQDSSVKIVDLNTLAVTASLAVKGPEKMLKVNTKIWVLCQGGFSVDSAIVIIDIASKTITDTIQVYPQPSGIKEDMNGHIWVLCIGRNAWHPGGESKGHLLCLDSDDYSVIRDIEFPTAENHPEELEINETGNVLYYRYPGGICKFSIAAVQPETSPFISRANGFYALAYDPQKSMILGTDPLNFTQNGWIFRYNSNTGALVDSIEGGIVPGEIYFVP
jgi:hypothetical protein